MMSIQARAMHAPYYHTNQALRAYAPNSPRAKARLLVLSMLVDGYLDDAELECLYKEDRLTKLGVSSEVHKEVLSDFCKDVGNLPCDSANYLLAPPVLEQLLGEVTSIDERQGLLRHMFDIIRSDGHLADSESQLFWHAIDQWKFRAADTHMALHGQRFRGVRANESKLGKRAK